MNSNHSYNFTGGEELAKIGAVWFVSCAYHEYIDATHFNWQKISTYRTRLSNYKRTKPYHKAWLEEITDMNPAKLATNQIGLDGYEVIDMAIEILFKMAEE